MSLHTFLCMTIQITRPWIITKILSVWNLFCSSPIRTWLCNCPQCLCFFHIVVECIPNIHDQGKMLVLPNQLLCWVLSTSDQCFVSFQPIWCHPHTLTRTTLFHGVQRDIPNWECSPSHVSTGLSQIALPIRVLPKDDRTDFAQEERLGLPYWTMILAISCFGGRIQMSGHSDFGFFNNCGASSIFAWVWADVASAVCPSHPGSLDMTSMTFAAVILRDVLNVCHKLWSIWCKFVHGPQTFWSANARQTLAF